jgi:Ni/Fe-hydrogenase subunit HybB-like protein
MSSSAHTVILDGNAVRGVERDLLRTMEPLGRLGRIWIAGLVVVVLVGVYAYSLQLFYGLSVTAMRDHVSWGMYMGNFVFFIGISHAGTLISAILRVTGAEWRRPITRMAEAITVFALVVGASMVIIDLGRPDRVWHVIAYGRLQSPILWDVAAITTYLTGSILYLYVATIPDFAILARSARERGRSGLLARIYRALSLGFRGTPEQSRYLNRALAVMAVIIIPVAISVHTVVSWIFGMTVRPGWHSTVFGPYFVVGAIFSGTAAIILAMAVFRWAYGLHKYLNLKHFQYLSTLLLALTLLYIYFTVSEYLTIWYGGTSTDARLLELLMGWTPYGAAFWGWAFLGLLLPAVLLAIPVRHSLVPLVTASILINVGMWLKRYLIVVPTMKTPELPVEGLGLAIEYFPSWIEWSISLAGLAAFLLLFTLFSRVIPILSIWETAEDFESPSAGPPAPEPQSARRARAPAAAVSIALPVVAGAAAVVLGAGSLQAAEPAEQTPRVSASEASAPASATEPTVAVTLEEEGGELWIIATLTSRDSPVEGARVEFLVERTFGEMTLGEDVTLDDGTAGVPFPVGLRGGADGELRVVAEVREPAAFAGTRGESTLPGGEPLVISSEPWPPRALWASGARPELLLSIGVLLLGVWSTYAFVLVQLSRISRAPSTLRVDLSRASGTIAHSIAKED